MTKKINPKDKTGKLRAATLEFLKRNEPVRKCFENIVVEKEGFIPRELLETALVPNAVIGFKFGEGKVEPGRMYFHPRQDCDLEQVFTLLSSNNPDDTLIVGVDLSRPKDAIIAEFSILLDMQIRRTGKRGKWVPIVDELMEVWDLYEAAGKTPAIQSFRNISRKLGRPLSTVKDQWYEAYEKIYRKPYKPETKYTTTEKKNDAVEKLCARCPHLTPKGGKCHIGGEWHPCAEYLKIAGKEKSVIMEEYNDAILYEYPQEEPPDDPETPDRE